MEQSTEQKDNKLVNNPILSKSYKVVKKVLKYCGYATILYFAYEGFMAWK